MLPQASKYNLNCVKKNLLWPGAFQQRIYYHRMCGQLSTTCSNVQPNGEFLVAVNHNQLQTMVSETVDPIDWLHPPPSWAVPHECLMHSINQCNLSGTQTCNHSMRGNHLAYAATQDIKQEISDKTVFVNDAHTGICQKPYLLMPPKYSILMYITQKQHQCQVLFFSLPVQNLLPQNYQLLAVTTEVDRWGTPSCS